MIKCDYRSRWSDPTGLAHGCRGFMACIKLLFNNMLFSFILWVYVSQSVSQCHMPGVIQCAKPNWGNGLVLLGLQGVVWSVISNFKWHILNSLFCQFSYDFKSFILWWTICYVCSVLPQIEHVNNVFSVSYCINSYVICSLECKYLWFIIQFSNRIPTRWQ